MSPTEASQQRVLGPTLNSLKQPCGVTHSLRGNRVGVIRNSSSESSAESALDAGLATCLVTLTCARQDKFRGGCALRFMSRSRSISHSCDDIWRPVIDVSEGLS